VLLLLPFATIASAQKFDVKIIGRQDSEKDQYVFRSAISVHNQIQR